MKTRSKGKIKNNNSNEISESTLKSTSKNNSIKNVSNKENSKTLDVDKKVEENNDENITTEDNSVLKKAKIYFIPKDNTYVLNCIACDCMFPDVPGFLSHICQKIKKLKKNVSKLPKTLEESIGTETNLVIGQDNLWHCRICDKGYDKKNSLKKHEQAHVSIYTCEVCGKGLKSSVNLREHMNIHSGARPYKCHLCPMAFARKWGLTSHVRSHTGDKRYGCQHCGKRFINGAILKIHVRMVHTKEKPCQCELCGKHFYSIQLLKEHKKRHMNIRPYKCEYENCGKCFYDKKQLNRHYVSHSDEKPFECTFNNCNAKFARHKTLQAHLKIHTGIKDYICSICGKAFAMNYNLTSHMRSHANGKVKIKREPHVKRQYRKKNKEVILNENEDIAIKFTIKEESESTQQNESNQFAIDNKEIIPVLQINESEMNEQTEKVSLNDTFEQSENKIEFNDIPPNIEYPDDKSLIIIYDNTTNSANSVPSKTSTPILINDTFNNMRTTTNPTDNTILTLPQAVIVTDTETASDEIGSISNIISQAVTMDQLTFHGNNLLHVYQIPN